MNKMIKIYFQKIKFCRCCSRVTGNCTGGIRSKAIFVSTLLGYVEHIAGENLYLLDYVSFKVVIIRLLPEIKRRYIECTIGN